MHENTEELLKDRGSTYGAPEHNLKVIGRLKRDYREGQDCYSGKRLGVAHDEAIEMCLMKIGRIATAKKISMDSYDDLIGYATIAKSLAEKELHSEQSPL